MLTEKEKKLIQRYYVYPTIVIAAIAIDLLIGFFWAFLVMLDDMAFNSTFLYMPGLIVYLGIVAIYLVIIIVLFVKVRSVWKKESWIRLKSRAGLLTMGYEDSERLRQIHGMNSAGNVLGRFENTPLKQAGDAMQAAAAVQTVAMVNKKMRGAKEDALKMAEIYRMKLPSAKKYMWLMILVPILLLTAIYIPEFAASKRMADQERERAAAVVYEVRDALEKGCARVLIDDPAEEYQSFDYQVIAHLNETDDKDQSYISLNIGNDGLISEVNYVLTIDIQDTKEANLERTQQNAAEFHGMLVDSGVEAKEAILLELPELPAAFIDQFTSGSYYDGINIHDENANCSAVYSTDSEDVNNEYNSFYFYLSMGEE